MNTDPQQTSIQVAPRNITFVDLDNPPASLTLKVGDEVAFIRHSAAALPTITDVDTPNGEFSLHGNMFLMVPLGQIKLPGQPASTVLIHHAVATTAGSGQVSYLLTPPNQPGSPAGTTAHLPYTVN